MNSSQAKIAQLKAEASALRELLKVSEESFLKEAGELEKANKQLVKENTYRIFFEASPEAMLTLYDGRFIDCNDSAVKMLKAKDKEEVLNTHPWDLSPEYQMDGRLSSEKAEEMIAIALKQVAHSFEWYHKRVNGEIFPVEVLLTSVVIEGKQMFNVTWRELTEKKRAEKELNEYHQHLEELVEKKTEEISIELENHKRLESDIRQILEVSSDAIRVIDGDHNIVYCSESFARFENHNKNPLGKKCYEAAREKECFTKNCPLNRVLKDGKKFSFERKMKSKGEREAFYHVDVIPYMDAAGNFLGIIENYRDITEEKEIKEKIKEEISKHKRLEKEYRTLFDSSADAIMIYSSEGFIDCNKATIKLFGLSSKKQFLKKHPRDISPEKQPDGQYSKDLAKRYMEKARKEGSTFFEWVHCRRDGTPFPAEVLISRTEYHGEVMLQATVRDITERKQAEEKLKREMTERGKLAEKYSALLKASADSIGMFDENGFFECNRAFLEISGLSSKEEVLHKQPEDFSAPEQPDGKDSVTAAKEHIEKACREGMDFFEWICKRKDGSLYPCEIMLSRMEYQGGVALLIISRDITERKRAEEEISHINAIQKLILENSTLGIALVKNRIFEWVNGRVGELLQLPLDKLQGASTRVVYPSQEIYEHLGKTAYPVLAKGKRSDNILKLKRSDGTLFWCRFIGKALDPEDVNAGSVWMLEDITEEMEARKLAEENAQHKGRIEMANNILHDIGNAMTGISTYVLKPQMEREWPELQSFHRLHDLFMENSRKLVEALGEDRQKALDKFIKVLISSFEQRNSQYVEFSEKISDAVGHVCSVLDLQRHYLKEKSMPLVTEINIANMINDTLIMMAGSLNKRNINVNFDVYGKKPNISGDQTRLMRVFLNIIKNACEAFDKLELKENRTLDVTISKDEKKKEISIVFADNAVGLTRGMLKKVFDRGVTTKKDGSGIGLHECRSIVESHGGTMKMKSNGINTGASTIITFPCLKQRQNDDSATE